MPSVWHHSHLCSYPPIMLQNQLPVFLSAVTCSALLHAAAEGPENLSEVAFSPGGPQLLANRLLFCSHASLQVGSARSGGQVPGDAAVEHLSLKQPPAVAVLSHAVPHHCRLEGRELQRWVPDEAPGEDLSLEGPSGGGRGPHRSGASGGVAWDQFATNQQMFGVQSSFNEDLYTTKLDPR